MNNWLVEAREASGLTQEECACALHCPTERYCCLERHPGELCLNELRALRRLYGAESRRIVWRALHEFKAG